MEVLSVSSLGGKKNVPYIREFIVKTSGSSTQNWQSAIRILREHDVYMRILGLGQYPDGKQTALLEIELGEKHRAIQEIRLSLFRWSQIPVINSVLFSELSMISTWQELLLNREVV